MRLFVRAMNKENKQGAMMRKSTINNTTKLIFIIFGIWPGATYVLIYRVYWIISLSTDEICHLRFFLAHLPDRDLSLMVDCLSSFLAHFKVIAKVFIFWISQRKFIKILKMMKEDWEECTESDVNMRETMCKAKLSDRITNLMFILHVITIAAYGSNVFFADFESSDRLEPPLIIKVRLPIGIDTKRFYRIYLSVHYVHMTFIGCGAGLVNSLLLTLILHVGGQIDIVRCWLNELVTKGNEEGPEYIARTTGKIVRKHQKIIIFSECIEDLYAQITLVLFVSNTLLLCTLGFLVLTAIETGNAMQQVGKFILFYTITNLEAFIFCYAGEYLQNKSRAIGMEAYNCSWYDLKPEQTRNLVFIMLRTQKKLTLTVGRIMELSLESFTNIMKASGSYMSMLLAMR